MRAMMRLGIGWTGRPFEQHADTFSAFLSHWSHKGPELHPAGTRSNPVNEIWPFRPVCLFDPVAPFGCIICLHCLHCLFALFVCQVFCSPELLLTQSGTLSMPDPPRGRHLAMRFAASQLPLTAPCFSRASSAYNEQLG